MNRLPTVVAAVFIGVGLLALSAAGWAAPNPKDDTKPSKKGTIYQQKKTERLDTRIRKPDQRINPESATTPRTRTDAGAEQRVPAEADRVTVDREGAQNKDEKSENESTDGTKKVSVGGSIEVCGQYGNGGKKDSRDRRR